MELNFDNSEMDTMMLRKEDHHSEMSDLLNTIIEQNDKNNPEPILETIVQQNETIKEKVETAGSLVAQAIEKSSEDMKKVVSVLEVVNEFLPKIGFLKGEKGDKGDKGDRGDAGRDGRDGVDGKTPQLGVDFVIPKDGRDGRDGKDAVVDYELIVDTVSKTIPKPKDGKPGKDGSPDTGEQIVSKLRSLEYAKKLSYDDLKDAPDMAHLQRLISARDYDFTELKDAPSSYAGQAGKSIRVKSDEKGLEFFNSSSSATFYDNQVYTSADWVVGGGITTITLADIPISGSVHAYLNGSRVKPVANDLTYGFTVSGNQIIFPYEFDSSYDLVIDFRA